MNYILKYAHPAVPKDKRIKVNDNYDLEFLKNIYTMELIKVFFTPVGFEWKDLEVKDKIYIEEKSIVPDKEIKNSDDKNSKVQYNNFSYKK